MVPIKFPESCHWAGQSHEQSYKGKKAKHFFHMGTEMKFPYCNKKFHSFRNWQILTFPEAITKIDDPLASNVINDQSLRQAGGALFQGIANCIVNIHLHIVLLFTNWMWLLLEVSATARH